MGFNRLMILNKLALSAIALAVACMLGTPAATLAVQSSGPVTQTYSTALTQTYGSPYPVTGSLQLIDDGNGILHGYYRPDDNGQFVPVTGGVDGSRIWIDFGSNARLKINGHLEGQKIVGSSVNGADAGQLQFVATPK